MTRASQAAGGPTRTRVLCIVAGLPAGGAERQLALLLRGLDRAAFEPGLLIFNAAEKVHYREVLDQPIWFRALGLSGGSAAKLIWPIISGIDRAVREFAPDVVYATLNVANHTTRLSKLLFRWLPPIVTSVRVGYTAGYRWREKLAERLLWRLSASIVCNAPATKDELMADLGLPGSRVAFIPNGIDPSFFDIDAGDPPSWWPQGRVALTVGRLSDQKNHLALVEALSAINRSHGLGEWKFVCVGEGEREGAVHSAIAAAGLSETVLLHRPVSDLRPLYRAAELVVMPSRFEGMPNVALEAQAAACPVAITVPANRAGVVSPESGYLLDDDLAAALAQVLAVSAEQLKARGQIARTRMLAEYSSDKMIQRTQQLLRQVATGAQDLRIHPAGEKALS